jgi:hypothetical protein
MIGPPPGTRVYLACGVTDMRRYVEYTIMQSPRCSNQRTALLSTN